jgi:hexokinase
MWEVPFAVDTAGLEEIVKHMHSEMDVGLQSNGKSTLKMLPAYVANPSGDGMCTIVN